MATRLAYTDADHDLLAKYLVTLPESSWRSVKTYAEMARRHPHHTQQSWHSHFRDSADEQVRRKIAKLKRVQKAAAEAKRLAKAAAAPQPVDDGGKTPAAAAPRESTSGSKPKPQPARASSTATATAPQPATTSTKKRKRDSPPPSASDSDSDSDSDSSFGNNSSPPPKRKKTTKVPFTAEDETALVKMLVIYRRSYDPSTKKYGIKMATVFERLEEKYPEHTQSSWQSYHAGHRDAIDARVEKRLRQLVNGGKLSAVPPPPARKNGRKAKSDSDGSDEEAPRRRTKSKSKSAVPVISDDGDSDDDVRRPPKKQKRAPSAQQPASSSKGNVKRASTAPASVDDNSDSNVPPAAVAVPRASTSDAKKAASSSALLKSESKHIQLEPPSPPPPARKAKPTRAPVADFSEEDDQLIVRFAAEAISRGKGVEIIWAPLGRKYPTHSPSEWKHHWYSNAPSLLSRCSVFMAKGKGTAVSLDSDAPGPDQQDTDSEPEDEDEDEDERPDDEEIDELEGDSLFQSKEAALVDDEQVDELQDESVRILAPATSSLPDPAPAAHPAADENPSPPTPKPTPPHSRSQDEPSVLTAPSHGRKSSLPSPFIKTNMHAIRTTSIKTEAMSEDDLRLEAELNAPIRALPAPSAVEDDEGESDSETFDDGAAEDWQPQGIALDELLAYEASIEHAAAQFDDDEAEHQFLSDAVSWTAHEHEQEVQRQEAIARDAAARVAIAKAERERDEADAERREQEAAVEDKRRKRREALAQAERDETARAAVEARRALDRAALTKKPVPAAVGPAAKHVAPIVHRKRPRASDAVTAASESRSPSVAQVVASPSVGPSRQPTATSPAAAKKARVDPPATTAATRSLVEELDELAHRYSIKRKKLQGLFYCANCPKDMVAFEDLVQWYVLAESNPAYEGRDELERRVGPLVWSWKDDVVVLGTDRQAILELERTKAVSARTRKAVLKSFDVVSPEAVKKRWPFA